MSLSLQAAHCYIHIAALIAEYLKRKGTYPQGVQAFRSISPNIEGEEKGIKSDSGMQDVQYTEVRKRHVDWGQGRAGRGRVRGRSELGMTHLVKRGPILLGVPCPKLHVYLEQEMLLLGLLGLVLVFIVAVVLSVVIAVEVAVVIIDPSHLQRVWSNLPNPL